MPLYVIRPDPPPAGQDWLATVPGQYLYDITGITATLTTHGAPDEPTDVSGNGLNGTYDDGGSPLQFFPGALTGNDGLDVFDATMLGNARQGWANNGGEIPLTGDFSIVWWFYSSPLVPGGVQMVASDSGASPVATFISKSNAGGSISYGGPGGTVDATWLGPISQGAWHLIGMDYNAGTQHARLWLDGVEQILAIDTPGPATSGVVDRVDFGNSGGWAPTSVGGMDEFAYFDHNIDTAGHAALFAAAPNFAAYVVACLTLTPLIYYHLDGALSPGGDRQVVLEVTDGSYNVEDIPTGFPETVTTVPLTYSWQPKLRSSTQTQNGASTAVAIPRLLVPAGYTVGTRTLDLSPNDQWSDIAIWWDSTQMDLINNPYAYPPGQHLVYVSDPNAPVE